MGDPFLCKQVDRRIQSFQLFSIRKSIDSTLAVITLNVIDTKYRNHLKKMKNKRNKAQRLIYRRAKCKRCSQTFRINSNKSVNVFKLFSYSA